jgi:hypothetical protein
VSVVVFGGYGVFGSLVCRELAGRGIAVTVAGRDAQRAAALARELGADHRATFADVTDAASIHAALSGHRVAVHCAGPFHAEQHALLDACLEAGCHSVDIADDRAYVALVRSRDAAFRARGMSAAFGCSSLPGLSGALAEVARRAYTDAPERARVTLFIGNDNTKSATAIQSVLRLLGRPIAAPQGTLRGFRDHERVTLPEPFGVRTAYAFEGPDYDLLPQAVGVGAVSVLVGFESRLAGPLFASLPRFREIGSARAARVLAGVGAWIRSGSSGGSVIVDLFWRDGRHRRAGVHAVREGQRLAALPAALAAQALLAGTAARPGAVEARELLGADALLSQVEQAGFRRIS